MTEDRPIVTFLTDFGVRDTFVGQMKGVVLSACRDATLVDLTHGVTPQAILEGAVQLQSAWRWFPEGTIHVAVVDPGVGGARKALAVRVRSCYFLVPDNGLISGVISAGEPEAIVQLNLDQLARDSISRTFHGRDVFARAAGMLANGARIETLGAPIDVAQIQTIEMPVAMAYDDKLIGEILIIDRYGNAMTNISADTLDACGEIAEVECGRFRVSGLLHTYSDADSGSPVALVSSMNSLELAVRDGSASERYDLGAGMRVTVKFDRRSR